MTEAAFRPSEEQLHAYVDGFLDRSLQGAVERFLAENPGEALRIEAYRQQNAALQALRALPESRPFTVPEFRARIRWSRLAVQVAAAVLLLAVGGGAGWWGRVLLAPREPLWVRLVDQAERAYQTFVPEVVHPVEVTRDQEQHLRTWLSRRLGTPVAVPVLTSHGYELVGGRLLPGDPGPAALFMYQDAQGSRLTLYVLAAPSKRRDTAFRYVQSGSLWICYWMGENIDFALTGEVDRDQIKDIAKTAYMQLNNMKLPSGGDW